MKFDCGLTHYDKSEHLGNWHEWFAWYPITLKSHDCRWLEKVWRRRTHYEWDGAPIYEYRAQGTLQLSDFN